MRSFFVRTIVTACTTCLALVSFSGRARAVPTGSSPLPGRSQLAARTTRSFLTFAALCVAALVAVAKPATAQAFYESLASFNAAATTGTLYDFEGIAPPNDFTENPDVLIIPTPGRVTFSVTGGSNAIVYAVDSNFDVGLQLSDGSDCVAAGDTFSDAPTTRISLDNFYTAFGIEYGMSNNRTSSYTFTLFNDNIQVGTPFIRTPIGSDNFFGVTSAIAFNNVRVTAPATVSEQVVLFDNARTGSIAAAVPEAGSLALLLPTLGVLGAVVARRRK